MKLMSKAIVLNVKIGLKAHLHNFEIHDEKESIGKQYMIQF